MDAIDNKKFRILEEYRRYWQLPNNNINYVPLMNHGYHGFLDRSLNIQLTDEEKPFKYMFALYAHLFENYNIDANQKSVLDIGCGYGKGINFLKRIYNISETYGLDLNPYHVYAAEKIFKDVKFITFDARNLDLLNLKVDIAISVESLCYYTDSDSFYKGLKSIVKENGDIIITTMINDHHFPIIIDKFKKHNLNIIKIDDITENVFYGCSLQLELLDKQDDLKKINGARFFHERNCLIEAVKGYQRKEFNYYTFYIKNVYV